MTLEESIKLLALIKLAYPNSYKDIDRETQLATVNMWHRAFEGTQFPIVQMALEHFIKGSKFPPTIADIIDELKRAHYEAWQNVVTLPEGQTREINRHIMSQTARYTERNDSVIHYGAMKNLLGGNDAHRIEEGKNG